MVPWRTYERKKSFLSPLSLKNLHLKNRITMAPLFLGYANPDGTVNSLILDHYQEMAASGASLIVVENAAVDPKGMGSPFTLRVDEERFLLGLSGLAKTIHRQGALAFQQINHAGRYAYGTDKIAPSPFETYGWIPGDDAGGYGSGHPGLCDRRLAGEGGRVRRCGASRGNRLPAGPISFTSNQPTNRCLRRVFGKPYAFPLAGGRRGAGRRGAGFPCGYRFLADEWLPEGLHPEETTIYARELEKRGMAYLSVMAGTYDSFFLPENLKTEKKEGYMASFAGRIKEVVPKNPGDRRRQDPDPGNGRTDPGRGEG